MTTINCEQLAPGMVMPGSSSTIPQRRNPIDVPSTPAPGPTAAGDLEPAGTKDGSESGGGENRPPDRNRRQPKKNYTSPLDSARSSLPDDPSQWRGRRIQSRKNGTVFTIRQVFKSGRVELEKNWMMYLSTVATVRAEYEACG